MAIPGPITVITLAIKALSLFFSAYFLIIAAFCLKKTKRFPQSAPMHRFAVIIPARNEAQVIGGLVESLRAQDYPGELFDVYVVPNNCADTTERAARAAGANIISCASAVKCKGDALRQSFELLLDKRYGYDAFCVFDADNIADKHFLSEMNNAFCSGAKVAKGRTEARNAYDSWVSGCYSIYFGMFNVFFNRARAACGLSAKLIGTAFAVHRDVLERNGGWNTVTMAEDAEFASQCALAGERVAWVPEAIAYDEEPTSFRLSLIQRKRWCSGIMQVSKLSFPSLLRALRDGNRPLIFDFLMFMLMPFIQALSPIPLVAGFLLPLLKAQTPLSFLLVTAVPALLYYIGATLLALIIANANNTLSKRLLKSVCTYALFTISWIPLQIASLFKKTVNWTEIRHTGRVSLAKRKIGY